SVVQPRLRSHGDAAGDESAVRDDDVVGLDLQPVSAVEGETDVVSLKLRQGADGGAQVGERSPTVLHFARLLADSAAEAAGGHVDEPLAAAPEGGARHVHRSHAAG